MSYLPNALFAVILTIGIGWFVTNIQKLIRNIKQGRKVEVRGSKLQRWKHMARLALGQSRMLRRPIAGILHLIVYMGFIIINIEVVEIIADGLLGTHRIFSSAGRFYGILIGTFETLALFVLIAAILFWIRRNVIRLARFSGVEMTHWPKRDANNILYFEVVLMLLFLVMNATDTHFQAMHCGNVVSRAIAPLFGGLSENTLHIIERTTWWLHIVGILVFLNYLYYSKHLHILLAFPNTFYARLLPNGQFSNLNSVTKAVKMMMYSDGGATETSEDEMSEKFGASDVQDLTRIQLLNAYSCTECGRCTSECPANKTGKKLSPRKIMMDTRDRLEAVGKNLSLNKGIFKPDGKQLLGDYITREALWACTSCHACVEACPIGIDPLSIILDMRRYLVMEQSAAPAQLNNMMTNIENNGAPWPYHQMDRLHWKYEHEN